MKQLKKRTLALVLASVITVVGACGEENYKNSLMSLELEGNNAGSVSLVLRTKIDDNTPVIPKKTSANTYIIMLPETDGKEAKSPKPTGNVESINIKTMPYTTNGKGYTKITVKTTSSNTTLSAKKALYRFQPSENYIESTANYVAPVPSQDFKEDIPERNMVNVPAKYDRDQKPDGKPADNKPQQFNQTPPETSTEEQKAGTVSENNTNTVPENADNSDKLLWLFGILTVMMVCIFIFMKSSRKMAEIVGEQLDFSSDGEEKEKKREKQIKIKNTINNLNQMYEKPLKMPTVQKDSDITADEQKEENENTVIVDLDELFQASDQMENTGGNIDVFGQDDNLDLDEFLSSFDLEEAERIMQEEIEENNLMEELYKKYILNGNLTFSEKDVSKINELLNSEINSETLKNISEYAVSNPIAPKRPSKNEILEDFITAFTINQNLSFSKDDVDALSKLIDVEIDRDFITDLTTNPERTVQMQKEIESRQIAHKSHEILTLNVKDMLPDLSEALKKQGNKRIEYEVKPQVVYYNDSYEVSTIDVHNELPDLTLNFDNPEYNKYRPSDKVELVAEGYDVQTLDVNNSLPDLKDVLSHPEKYSEKKETVKVDEDALLSSISNVTFKPFYDGEETFEIINKFEEDRDPFDFGNLEEKEENSDTEPAETAESFSHTEQSPMELLKLNKTVYHIPEDSIKDTKTSELLQLIEDKRAKRTKKIQEKREQETQMRPVQNKGSDKVVKSRTCSVKGESFNILNTAEISENSGCYLCKNDSGYAVVGYERRALKVLKRYDNLRSQRIQVRLNEKLEDDVYQYIVRIGTNKFIVNFADNSMEYIMELC